MSALIRGLHHVTATVTHAQEDLDFYVQVLGLRLVKKTVNFDNHHVYHFYYGNETGAPGTIMTTFPYGGRGVAVGTKGAGQITVTSFSVLTGALDFWHARLADREVHYLEVTTSFGERAIELSDPSGLTLRLVESSRDERMPWMTAEIGPEHSIRGLHSVSLLVREPKLTIAFLCEMLDGAVVREESDCTRLGMSGSAPGHLVEVIRAAGAKPGTNGLGTVHHVAFGIGDGHQQLDVRSELKYRGFQVTDVLDRQYFRSIYFREPNGVLFEVATLLPGFTIDEPLDELGRSLKLPPWEEPHRAAIEAGLPQVSYE